MFYSHMVNLILIGPIRESPREFVGSVVWEECSPEYKPIVTEYFAILIDHSFTLCPHRCFPVRIVRAHLRINVAENQVSRLPFV